jgi:hypothetical protein
MRLINKQNQVIAFFDLVDDSLDSFFKHSAQHRTRYEPAHLELDHMRTA